MMTEYSQHIKHIILATKSDSHPHYPLIIQQILIQKLCRALFTINGSPLLGCFSVIEV